MPPGPIYNFLCVAHSLGQVLNNVAQIRAAQLARNAGVASSQIVRRRRGDDLKEDDLDGFKAPSGRESESVKTADDLPSPHTSNVPRPKDPNASSVIQVAARATEPSTSPEDAIPSPTKATPRHATLDPTPLIVAQPPRVIVDHVDSKPIDSATNVKPIPSEILQSRNASSPVLERAEPLPIRTLQSSKVPSSRIGRLFHYGGLAASLGFGAATELVRRSTQSTQNASNHNSLMMSEGNIKRLVAKLTKMRGAALKLGQFLSIQDSHVLPPEVEEIFRRVQDSAHYMPDWQMEQVMKSSLGADWETKFTSFDRIPFAAASIGQVHSAVLAASVSPTGKDEPVAVKIQFPNIKESIDSDLGYVKLLMTAGRILPRGLFLDRTLQVMKGELADECAYTREASFLRRFGAFLKDDPRFLVPWVWDGSTDQVLVMERVAGTSVGGAVIEGLSQEERDMIAERIIGLCLHELFVFRMMQTDPNWTNFLWNSQTRQVELVDFGATREYSKEFIDNWLRLLQAAASDDRQACINWSREVGYLTGQEDELMLDAHVKSMCLLATPFKASTPQPFAFGAGSSWADITAQIRAEIPAMLQHRLTPPPRETYSLNRKLSGAFLLAARLNAKVDCRALWEQVVSGYQFGPSK